MGMPAEAPVPTRALRPELQEKLLPGQPEIAAYLLSGLDQHDAVVLASSTGSGKTYLMNALLANDRPKRALLLTKNEKLVNDFIKVAKDHYGMEIKKLPGDWEGEIPEGHYITTYGTLRGNVERIAKQKWDWGLFDESAEARNWQYSDQGAALVRLNDSVGKAIYSSATPFHIPTELGYMTKLGLWDGSSFEKWGYPLGIRREATMNGGSVLVSGPSPRKMEKLRQQLIERGQFISLDKDMTGFTAHFGIVPMTPDVRQGMANAIKAFTIAADWYSRTKGKGGKVRPTVANQATFLKNYIERARLRQAVEVAKKAEAQGYKVIFFSENKKEVSDIYTFLHDADEGTHGQIRQLMPKLAGVWETLSAEFGDNIANFSGGHSAAREAQLQDFLSGRKQHIFATYGAGGVGVSLHDTVGDAPRFAVYLGLPWSGVMFDQAIGRPWRFGTKSDTRALFLASNSQNEMQLLVGRIGQRLTSLRAGVSGLASMDDPVVQSLHSLDGAIDYTHGGGFRAGDSDWVVPAREGAVQNWDKVEIPHASTAIGPDKGIKLPYSSTELARAGSQFDLDNSAPQGKGGSILYQAEPRPGISGKDFVAAMRAKQQKARIEPPPPKAQAAAPPPDLAGASAVRIPDNGGKPPNGGGNKPPAPPRDGVTPPPEPPSDESGNTSLERLTARLSERPAPATSPAKTAKDMLITIHPDLDSVKTALGKIKAAAQHIAEKWKSAPRDNDYERATGIWSGDDNVSSWNTHAFVKVLTKVHPDAKRREAIANYIEADGDTAVLAQRAKASAENPKTKKYARGYEDALHLTPEEVATAKDIIQHNKETLQEAIKAGMLQSGVENYLFHTYSNASEMIAKLRAEQAFTSLTKNPSFTKKRTYESYFDAEQEGFKPLTKDVAFLVSARERAFRQAVAARHYIERLTEATAPDGRPVIVPTWVGHEAMAENERGQGGVILKTNLHPGEEYAGYVMVEHPALKRLRFAGRSAEGNPLYFRANVLVHPDYASKIKNNLTSSAIRRFEMKIGGHTFKPGQFALETGSEIKHAILSFSAFHQTTLMVHALEHRVNPFKLKKVDFNDATQRALVDHYLNLIDYNGYQLLDEGNASGGLVSKIPVMGWAYRHYTEYLFKSLLPRLKMTMALDALERNRQRYGKELSEDQLLFKTATEANAAFGGINYRAIGRNKTLQDVMRLAMISPDFSESRAKFVGQALRPYGREQLVALVGGAVAMYVAGRILNVLVDDDPHWDKPFALVYQGKEYRLRTIQEDAYDFARDPMRFVWNRRSPLVTITKEALTGRDEFGRRKGLLNVAASMPEDMAPMPLKPALSGWKLTENEVIAESLLRMVGINVRSDKPRADQNGWLTPPRHRRSRNVWAPNGNAAGSNSITLEPPPKL